MTIPARFVISASKPGEFPVATLPEVAINVFWHAKFHRAADNQWLRTLIFESFVDDGSR